MQLTSDELVVIAAERMELWTIDYIFIFLIKMLSLEDLEDQSSLNRVHVGVFANSCLYRFAS